LIAARTLTAPLPVLKWLTQVWSGEKRVRIFVTGGSGFLGSRMIRTLDRRGHQVFQRRPVFVAHNGADDWAGIYC
jgi:hypothetical protein